MKLYWSPRSPFVRKVMVCAHELGIAEHIEPVYALVSMNQVNAEVMRVNPIGRIPALVTDKGTVLYDSHVICEYLDAEHGDSRLFGKNGPQRWDALRRLALGDGLLETLVLWRSESQRPAAQQSAQVISAFGQKTTSGLAAIEGDISAFERGQVDIGMIAIGCTLGYLDFRYPQLGWRTRCPRSAKWFESFNARPSMQQTMPHQEA